MIGEYGEGIEIVKAYLVMYAEDDTHDEVKKVCASREIAEQYKKAFLIDEYGEEKHQEYQHYFWIWELDISDNYIPLKC